MSWASTSLVALCAYVLGGFSAGYWLVRLKTGKDVRAHGSGSTGATNTGRLLGHSGFALVLIFDAAKGAIATALATSLQTGTVAASAAALAVVIGHIWPVQLAFRGGKGIAPLLGAWLVLEPLALVPCLLLALLALALTKRFTLSGLCGLILLPFGAWWFSKDAAIAITAASTLAACLYSHRSHLRSWRSDASLPRSTGESNQSSLSDSKGPKANRS